MSFKNIISVLTFVSFQTVALSQADSTFKNPHGERTWLRTNYIVGSWVQDKDNQIEINFVETTSDVKIYPVMHMLPYTFIKNKEGHFSSLGYAPNWPPYYVDILYIDENTVDLFYYHQGFNGKSDRYKRKQ